MKLSLWDKRFMLLQDLIALIEYRDEIIINNRNGFYCLLNMFTRLTSQFEIE